MARCFVMALVLAVGADARHCLYDNMGSLQSCGRGCFSRPSATQAFCVSGCLSGKGVSGGCSRCLGNGFTCALRSCRSACSAGLSNSRCTSCIASSCGLFAGATKSAANETEAIESMAEVLVAVQSEESSKNLGKPEEEAKQTEKTEEAEATLKVQSAGCYENQGLLKYCQARCIRSGAPGKCSTECLNSRGTSSGCAACFGDRFDCTILRCWSNCRFSSYSPACTSCVRSKCPSCNAGSEKLIAETATAAVGKTEAEVYP
ncbi:unnamed protein product [Effrenium voratum]|uniref:Uncharacterized protein n=1 Tax=Effrenium voratum TaxID=2562239 RepID=A0AA36J4W2_9DINO|nr:unnamed protein product [Effrenium voratum]CAJ1448312.1 unnamed protein product [Effrenium voratum]